MWTRENNNQTKSDYAPPRVYTGGKRDQYKPYAAAPFAETKLPARMTIAL